MVPTKERNHTALLLRFQGEGILIDCGEGTQRQIKLAGHKLTEITRLLITHWHGDHVLGIPGLIQSLGSSQYNGKLQIYGPKGTKQYMENMLKAFVFDNRVNYTVHEVEKGRFIDAKKFAVESYPLEHGISTVGYRFIEKDRRRIRLAYTEKLGIPEGPLLGKLQNGKDITYKGRTVKADDATYIVKGKIVAFVLDTVYCEGCLKLAKDADLLVSEAAFDHDLEDKANFRKHLTAQQAAQIASQSGAKKLILTHFSTRYKDTSELEKTAKDIFPDTICAHDLMKVKI
jgi:ribonuclease Z